MEPSSTIDTVYGRFLEISRSRLELTYDYENGTICTFSDVTALICADVVLDVGANIGVYTVFSLQNSSAKEIHSFEPAPDAYAILLQNISLQDGSDRISCHNVAASDQDALVQFNLVTPTSGANAIVATGKQKPGESIRVPAKRLDNLYKGSDQVISVKIDVEGHEVLAVRGMEKILLSNKCFIQCECLSDTNFVACQALLSSYGYSYVFSLRDDHFFLSAELMDKKDRVLEIISRNMRGELRDLLQLRRQKRKLSVEAKRLSKLAAYKRDPLFLSRGEKPT